jgi:hypothetical protein
VPPQPLGHKKGRHKRLSLLLLWLLLVLLPLPLLLLGRCLLLLLLLLPLLLTLPAIAEADSSVLSTSRRLLVPAAAAVIKGHGCFAACGSWQRRRAHARRRQRSFVPSPPRAAPAAPAITLPLITAIAVPRSWKVHAPSWRQQAAGRPRPRQLVLAGRVQVAVPLGLQSLLGGALLPQRPRLGLGRRGGCSRLALGAGSGGQGERVQQQPAAQTGRQVILGGRS